MHKHILYIARENLWWGDEEDDLHEDGIHYTIGSHADYNDDEYAVCPAVSCAGSAVATPVHRAVHHSAPSCVCCRKTIVKQLVLTPCAHALQA